MNLRFSLFKTLTLSKYTFSFDLSYSTLGTSSLLMSERWCNLENRVVERGVVERRAWLRRGMDKGSMAEKGHG